MASLEAKYGLLVPLEAKADQASALVEFLQAGYTLVNSEPETIQWFGLKYENDDSNVFAIFDTFATESGRSVHLLGKVAEALMANAPALLTSPPSINQIDILASKVASPSAGIVNTGTNAGLTVGLRVLLTAKPDKVQAVKEFLISALPLVEAEPETPVWYAIAYPDKKTFGIVDFFANEQGRDAHLKGKVAEALFANVEELLEGAPDVVKVGVVAAKLLV